MKRLAVVVVFIVLGIAPTALTQSPATSFAFTTYDVPLSLFPSAINTEGAGINIFGTTVGDYCNDNVGDDCHGFRRSALGVFTGIDVPNSSDTFAPDINSSGVIVGHYLIVPPAAPTRGRHCFVLNFVLNVPVFSFPPDVPGALRTRCRGINDQGQIVGAYDAPGPTGPVRHGFLLSGGTFSGGVFTGGVFTTIDVPGATRTDPARINNSGQIVGRYVSGQDGLTHGFLFDGATFTTIDFPGAKETVAGGINNQGQIVGVYRDANNFLFGFIRTTNTSQNLPGPPTFTQIVLPGPGQNVGAVVQNFDINVNFTSGVGGINDRGQISGEYWGIDNHVHGFVTAPRQDFEVTLSAHVVPSPTNPNSIIIKDGVFEGDPVGEGSFTLDVSSPLTAGILGWGQGLFVLCGRFQPPQPPLLLTTSTGDQISVDLLLTVCQTAFPPVPSSGVISGIYRITGGTGRFGGASGSGFVTGTFRFPAVLSLTTPGTLTFTLQGTISR